jgi:anti-anti-sigma factor
MLDIITSESGGQKVISLIGELDIATVDAFKKSIDDASEGAQGITLDMAKLSFVDSTGVGGLLNVVKSLKKMNLPVKIMNVSTDVYEVFDLLGLPMLLGGEIFE